MARPQLVRPGGRSERIQKAVHAAVKSLKVEMGSDSLSIPMIAERAGVTPSTIYRRWSTLGELLDSVASDYFHGDRTPPDTGSLAGDLNMWVDNFVDDFASELGRSMLLERVANLELSRRTAGYAYSNLRAFVRQAEARGETAISPDRLMDMLVAPIVYRMIFADQPITQQYRRDLVERSLAAGSSAMVREQPSFADYVIFE